MATRNIKPATQTNAPKLTTTTNGNKLGEQTSKLLQIETNGEAKEQEVAETEVIELKSTRSSPPMPPKEQKPIQPPPPSIAVNESRYTFLSILSMYLHHSSKIRNFCLQDMYCGFSDRLHWKKIDNVAQNDKRKKTTWVFVFQKYGKNIEVFL